MIEAVCDCGAVRLQIDAAPRTVTDCNCGICRRYGTLWAYYSQKQVRISGPTTIYLRGDRELEFHRCTECGCVSHWVGVEKSRGDRMGVNARLMPPEVVEAATVVTNDGASW